MLKAITEFNGVRSSCDTLARNLCVCVRVRVCVCGRAGGRARTRVRVCVCNLMLT